MAWCCLKACLGWIALFVHVHRWKKIRLCKMLTASVFPDHIISMLNLMSLCFIYVCFLPVNWSCGAFLPFCDKLALWEPVSGRILVMKCVAADIVWQVRARFLYSTRIFYYHKYTIFNIQLQTRIVRTIQPLKTAVFVRLSGFKGVFFILWKFKIILN